MLDLSAGQGQAAAACLQLRLCCVAFCLTEAHAQALEKRLTDHALQSMQDEASTFYRPEMVQKSAAETAEEPDEEKPKPKKAPKSGGKPPAAPKAKSKKNQNEGGKDGENEAEPKKKKPRSAPAEENGDGDEEGERSDSMPW